MNYVDGFLTPVKPENRDAYIAMSKKMTSFFEKHGAVRAVECWGDDIKDGKVTDFKRAVAAEPGETVVFSWIEWPSKDARDRAGKAMMEDPELSKMDMPFDGKRMIYGGFSMIHEFTAKG